jgi:hypothetical protein
MLLFNFFLNKILNPADMYFVSFLSLPLLCARREITRVPKRDFNKFWLCYFLTATV